MKNLEVGHSGAVYTDSEAPAGNEKNRQFHTGIGGRPKKLERDKGG